MKFSKNTFCQRPKRENFLSSRIEKAGTWCFWRHLSQSLTQDLGWSDPACWVELKKCKKECILVGWVPTAAVAATRCQYGGLGRPLPLWTEWLTDWQTLLKTLPSLEVGKNPRKHSRRIRTAHLKTISWYVLQWPPSDVTPEGMGIAGEQVWTGLQWWPPDVSNRGVGLGQEVPGLMSKGAEKVYFNQGQGQEDPV